MKKETLNPQNCGNICMKIYEFWHFAPIFAQRPQKYGKMFCIFHLNSKFAFCFKNKHVREILTNEGPSDVIDNNGVGLTWYGFL